MFPFLWMWISLSAFSVTSGVSGVPANSDVLWHRYVAAISRLHDVECSYEMQDRSYGHGDHLARGEGYFLNGRYRLFRFNLPRHFWYVERSNFEYEFLPPHDWADRVEFYSEQGGGVFLETHCSLHRSKSPIPYMVPHPVGVFTGGMALSLAELTNPSEWSISEIDGRLILDSQSTDRRIELELDSKHGWLPRRAEHHHKNGMVAFEVEEFHQVNGLWFPVVMRTMRSDRSDGKLVPVADAGHRLIVDKSSLKLNPRLPLSAYRFQPPAGAIVHDLDSGETVHGEVGLAKLAEFRSIAQLRAPTGSAGGSVSIAVWVAIASLVIFLSCCSLWLWLLMNKPRSLVVGVFLGIGAVSQIGCGGSGQSNEYMKPALKIKEITRSITAPPGVAVEGTEQFFFTNLSNSRVELRDPIANCSCIKEAKFNRVSLPPNETALLEVRYLQKVGMDPQKYQIGFSAKTVEGEEAYRVFLQLVPDRNWDVNLSSRLHCTKGIKCEFEITLVYDGAAPDKFSVLSPDGIVISGGDMERMAGNDNEYGLVRFRAIAEFETSRTGVVNFVFTAENKQPKQLTKAVHLIVESPVKFDAASYFWDGESIGLPISCPDLSAVRLISVADSQREVVDVSYDSNRGLIFVQRRNGSVIGEVLPLEVQVELGGSAETIETNLVLNH